MEKIKTEMAYAGYYLPAQYAKIKGVSRQYISFSIKNGKLKIKNLYGRHWIKLDDGEKAKEIYPARNIKIFALFGFKKRNEVTFINDNACVDAILLKSGEIKITFLNEYGDTLTIIGKLNHEE